MNTRTTSHLLLSAGLAVALLLGACRKTDTPGEDASHADSAHDTTGKEGTWLPKREPSRRDSVRVEGMWQPIELRLFGEGLPFTTYYPAEMKAEMLPADDGTKARFHAVFGGVENRSVYMEIFVPSEPWEMIDMKRIILGSDGMVQRNGWNIEPARTSDGDLCPWAHESYSFVDRRTSPPAVVHVCVGKHRDRAFYVVMHYPAEYAEGFVPRASLILRNIRWEDNGDPLRKDR